MPYKFNPFTGTFDDATPGPLDSTVPNATFSVVYTAAPGTNTINLGDLAISGSVFPDETILFNRMSLALGSLTYNLGDL